MPNLRLDKNKNVKTLEALKGFEKVISLKRVWGIEPQLTAWKAVVLPLNYTRMNRMHLF